MDRNPRCCQTCERQQQNKQATHGCVQCLEFLCNECTEYHKVLKATREHSVIILDEYECLSKVLLPLQTTCQIHNQRSYEYFCQNHEMFCCFYCKNREHRNCLMLDISVDSVSAADIDEKFNDVVKKTKCDIQNLEDAYENVTKTLKHLEDQRKLLISSIQEKKQKLQKLIETLDKKLSQTDREYQERTAQLQSRQEELRSKCSEMRTIVESLGCLLRHKPVGNDQLLLAVTQMKPQKDDANDILTTIEKLSDIKTFSNVELDIGDNEETTKLTNDPKKCRSNLNTSTCNLSIANFSAQTTVSSPYVNTIQSEVKSEQNVKEIKNQTMEKEMLTKLDSVSCIFNFQCKFTFRIQRKTPNISLTCVKVVRCSNLAIGESSQPRLLIYEKQGFKRGEMKLQNPPKSMALIESNTIAVSSLLAVFIIDIKHFDSMSSLRKLVVDNCHGLTYINRMLVVNCEHSGLTLMTMEGVIKICNSFMKGILYLYSTPENKVLSVKKGSEMVNTFDVTMESTTCNRCPNLLGASGITTDKRGNIYITCNYSNCVYMFEKDKKSWATVVSKTKGINNPSGIDYDKNSDELIVINDKGKSISVYEKH